MVSRCGATKRKKRAHQKAVEEPLLIVNCICCHCEAAFRPHDVDGSYLSRKCPSCGELLNEAVYDDACAKKLKEESRLKREVASLESEDEKWSRWRTRLRWAIFRPLCKLLDKRIMRIREEKDKLNNKRHVIDRRVKAYAISRYYTGEWYQRTGVNLKRTVVAPYQINVYYGKDGKWNIVPTDQHTAGLVAEFKVFQELLSRVENVDSVLCNAQIVPNIYLPHEQCGRKAEKLWTQIDCLLLTRQAAFVIEVKRRKQYVVSLKPFEEIWSSKSSDVIRLFEQGEIDDLSQVDGLFSLRFALRQNSGHAIALDETCSDYEFERIYEQVVFVGASSYRTDCDEFVDNVNVSSLGNGSPNFADIVECASAQLDDVLTQSRLDEIGEQLVSSYGDLNQKRAQLHAQRLANIHDSN